MVAIRQLNYCVRCGMPLGGSRSAGPSGPTNFCRSCGHPLRPHEARTSGPCLARAPFLVPSLPERAGAGRRGGAAVVDLIVAGAAALLGWGLGAEASVVLSGGRLPGAPAGGPSALAWVAGAVALVGYQPFFWSRRGQTPGMQVFGVQVTRPDGSPVGILRALARQLAMVGSALPLGLGFVLAARDPRRRAWHDRLSGTVTVNRPPRPNRTVRPPVATTPGAAPGRSAWDPRARIWTGR